MKKLFKKYSQVSIKKCIYIVAESPIKFLIIKDYLPNDIKIIWLSPKNFNFLYSSSVKSIRLLKSLSDQTIVFWNGEWGWQKDLVNDINSSNKIYFVENANMPGAIQFSRAGVNFKALSTFIRTESPDINRSEILQKYQVGFQFEAPIIAKLIEAINSQYYRIVGTHQRFRRQHSWFSRFKKRKNMTKSHQKPRNCIYCVLQVWDDTQLDSSMGRNREIISRTLELGKQMGLNVVFRLHPKCKCVDRYVDLLIGETVHVGPLHEALNETNIIAGYNSSVLIQSLLAGCQIVFFGDFLSPACNEYKGKVVQFEQMSSVLRDYFNLVVHDKEKISQLLKKP